MSLPLMEASLARALQLGRSWGGYLKLLVRDDIIRRAEHSDVPYWGNVGSSVDYKYDEALLGLANRAPSGRGHFLKKILDVRGQREGRVAA